MDVNLNYIFFNPIYAFGILYERQKTNKDKCSCKIFSQTIAHLTMRRKIEDVLVLEDE